MAERCASVICADDNSVIRCDATVDGHEVPGEHESTSDPYSLTIVWSDVESCGYWPAPACGHQRIETEKETPNA